jgi:hypothetical protein
VLGGSGSGGYAPTPLPTSYPLPASRARTQRRRDIVVGAIGAVVVIAGVATAFVYYAGHSSAQATPPPAASDAAVVSGQSGRGAGASVAGSARATSVTSPTTTPTATWSGSASPTSATPSATATLVTDPAQVVTQYFDDINAQDYAAAWQLGGKNFGQSYSKFVAGFNGTKSDAATAQDTGPTTASVQLTATQTNGDQQTFSGTFTVVNGEITQRVVQQTG